MLSIWRDNSKSRATMKDIFDIVIALINCLKPSQKALIRLQNVCVIAIKFSGNTQKYMAENSEFAHPSINYELL